MDYELCSAQLRDMTEQRECSRAKAERLMTELTNRECALKSREVSILFLVFFSTFILLNFSSVYLGFCCTQLMHYAYYHLLMRMRIIN